MSEHPTLPFDAPERWLPVVGWARLYEVSDLGGVRSLRRKTVSGWRGGRALGGTLDGHGYLVVALCNGPREDSRKIHHLVTDAFLGPLPAGMVRRHGPGGRLDNSLANLCFGTPSENQMDRVRDGTECRGERHGRAKLTWSAVAEIRQLAAAGEMQRTIALRYGVHFATVNLIIAGKTWRFPPAA